MLSVVAVVLVFAAFVQAAPNKHMMRNRNHPDILTPPERTIRVCAKPDSLFTSADESTDGRDSGFFVDLLAALTRETGIRFKIESHPDWAYARMNDDGTWDNTLVGGLITDQCDLIGPDVTVNSDAEKVIDFLTPIMPYKLMLLYNPKFGLPNEPPIPQYLIRDNHNLIYLKDSFNKTLHDIYENIDNGRPDSIVPDVDTGVQKVSTGNFAFIIQSNFLANAKAKANFPDELVAVAPYDLGKYFYSAMGVSMTTEIGKDLRQDLDVALEKLNEDGVIQSLLLKYHQGMEL